MGCIKFCIKDGIFDAIVDAVRGSSPMRTTVTIDDALFFQARTLSGIREAAPLIKAALQALIQRESAVRLARLGNSQPDLKDLPRKRELND